MKEPCDYTLNDLDDFFFERVGEGLRLVVEQQELEHGVLEYDIYLFRGDKVLAEYIGAETLKEGFEEIIALGERHVT